MHSVLAFLALALFILLVVAGAAAVTAAVVRISPTRAPKKPEA